MDTLKNLREVLKRLKRKKHGKTTIRLCPKCGSSKIRLSSSFDTYPRMYGITPGQYICENCSYKGPIVIELEEEKKPNQVLPAPAASSNSYTDF